MHHHALERCVSAHRHCKVSDGLGELGLVSDPCKNSKTKPFSVNIMVQAVSRLLPTAATRVRAGSGHVGFVVDKVALGQVFSQYFGFPCQFSLHRLLHIRYHLSSGAGKIEKQVDSVSPTPRN
jgi:hypothetical protein